MALTVPAISGDTSTHSLATRVPVTVISSGMGWAMGVAISTGAPSGSTPLASGTRTQNAQTRPLANHFRRMGVIDFPDLAGFHRSDRGCNRAERRGVAEAFQNSAGTGKCPENI